MNKAALHILLSLIAFTFVGGAAVASTEAGLPSFGDCHACTGNGFTELIARTANQVKTVTSRVGSVGRVMAKDKTKSGGYRELGRMVLEGSGEIGRTAAHVLFDKNGQYRKSDDGVLYFVPEADPSKKIPIHFASIDAGVRTGKITNENIHLDWAYVNLDQDVVELLGHRGAYAAMPGRIYTHQDFQKAPFRKATTHVYNRNNQIILESCQRTRTSPDQFPFASPESLAFINCGKSGVGSSYVKEGSSGTPELVFRYGKYELGGALVAKETQLVSKVGGSSGLPKKTPQVVLLVTRESQRAFERKYLEFLRSSGINPHDPSTWHRK